MLHICYVVNTALNFALSISVWTLLGEYCESNCTYHIQLFINFIYVMCCAAFAHVCLGMAACRYEHFLLGEAYMDYT